MLDALRCRLRGRHHPAGHSSTESAWSWPIVVIAMICQKPLAPSFEESAQLVESGRVEAGVRFMVHENFRFQPWYREIKRLIE